jgi:hypothetical protein
MLRNISETHAATRKQKLLADFPSFIDLFNSNDDSNLCTFYIEEGQVKTEWRESRRGRKREAD